MRDRTRNTYVTKVVRDRTDVIEAARRSIPINTYLAMLNTAALTGKIPTIDPVTGQPTGHLDDVCMRDRLDIAQFLVDKVMPSYKRVEPTADDGGLTAAAQDGAIAKDAVEELDTPQLRAVLATARSYDDADTSATSAASPSGASPARAS
jgi:hypothetical protein